MLKEWPEFLVSTSKSVLLYRNNRLTTVTRNDGLYYGITWNEHNIYIYRRNKKSEGNNGEIAIFSKDLKQIGVIEYELPHAHQILYYDKFLYITELVTNSVIKINVENSDYEIKNWTGLYTDINHINSMWKDINSFWVIYHNLTNTQGSEFSNSQIVELDNKLENVKRTITVGKGIHNITRIDNKLYFCNSDASTISVYDLKKNGIMKENNLKRWTRGLGINRDKIVVGTSPTCEERDAREQGNAEIYLLNRADLSILSRLIIPNEGSVYEIRLLKNDYAHNGLDCII